ncbi:zinc metalloprotease [Paenibacillus durus]|uniref:Peptidase M10 metallopeptidase domain-containing protein n=1 Tax=Paenibacillus durus ATCC 35681 TaxID=1333534 RepID=A0A0F7FCX9_PAEDU|nr:hypothetical protein [Paenibacillus durus]AKG36755.1 hypothetical protein VK70_21395 [Paenibacillus durus ATCC 35681]
MNTKFKRVFAVSLIFFLFSFSTAFAYLLKPYGWPKTSGQTYTVKVKYSTSDANYKTAWSTAVNDWNNKQSKIRFDLSELYTSSANSVGTMINSDTSIYGETTNTLTSDSSQITSFVARLNTANSEIAGNATVRRSTSNHELGHALALADNNVSVIFLAIMNQLRDRTTTYTPQTDDVNGVNAKYPF